MKYFQINRCAGLDEPENTMLRPVLSAFRTKKLPDINENRGEQSVPAYVAQGAPSAEP